AALRQNALSSVAYVSINGQALYPFCLLKRRSVETLSKHLDQQQFSIRRCFAELLPQVVNIQNQELNYHSLNSLEELQQYRK
ncbi:MAG: molybdenum cofactor guanylyltransferase, partial [Acinetobacter sp.]